MRKMVCVFAAAVLCACEAATLNGRRHIYEDYSSNGNAVDIAYGNDGLVWQTAGYYSITNASNDNVFGYGCWTESGGTRAYYLLDGGKLTIFRDWYAWGLYAMFRQRGGEFHVKNFQTRGGNSICIPMDLVFGGDGTADLGWWGESVPSLSRDMTIAFCDSIDFTASAGGVSLPRVLTQSGAHHIWAHNGGTAEYIVLYAGHGNEPVGDFFAFNGGRRVAFFEGNYGSFFGREARVCLYEGGGELELKVPEKMDLDPYNGATMGVAEGYPNFCTPEGNVVKSITLTPAAMSNIVEGVAQGWDYPPAVEFIDSTGTNAAAIVDYDYEERTITNITVLCGGEKYSEDVKVNFRYKTGEANRLLSTPLDCVVGPATSGPFTFSTAMTNVGPHFVFRGYTNECCELVVDMDRAKVADGTTITTYKNAVTVDCYYKPYFPNCTNIVIRSGALSSSSGSCLDAVYFPNCDRLELLGGHLGNVLLQYDDIVIAGTNWLVTHAMDGESTLVPPSGGRMTVDASLGTAAIMAGNARFVNASTITVKNWQSLVEGDEFTTVLDLSNMSFTAATTQIPTIVRPDDDTGKLLQLKWEHDGNGNPIRLLARRQRVGIVLLIR